ncbi:MAG: hypothetical protein AAGF85_00750 [Bacteroidota bacterium]
MATTTEQRKIEIIANGQKVNASLKEMKASAALLNNQLQKMEPGTDAFVKKSKELQGVRDRMSGVKDQMYGTQRAQAALTKGSGLLAKGFDLAVKAFLPLFAFQKIQQLVTGLFSLESQWTKLRGIISQTSDLQGEALDKAAARTQAIANTFGQDNARIFNAAKNLVNNFGASFDEAFDLVQKGLIASKDKSDEFLDNLDEYPTALNGAFESAESVATQAVKALNQGVFSDKGVDVLKEFKNRINEQNKATQDALINAFGPKFSNELFKGINDGSITVEKALKRVATRMNDTTIPANKLQTVVADVFGGPGEDAGMIYLKSLKDVGGEMDDLIDTTDTYNQQQTERLKLELELATAQEALTEQFEGSSGVFQNLMLQAKILFFDTLAKGIEIGRTNIVGLINYFIDLYNESTVVRAAVQILKAQFQTTFSFAKAQVVTIIDIFKSLGSIVKAVFTGNFEDIPNLVSESFEKIKGNYTTFGKEATENFQNAAKAVVSREKVALIDLDTEKPVEQAVEVGEKIAEVNENFRQKEADARAKADELKKAAEEESRAKKLERDLEIFEEDMELELLREENRQLMLSEQTQDAAMAALEAEQAQQDALLDIKKRGLEAQLALLIVNGKGQTKQAESLRNQILKIEKQKADSEVELEKKKVEAKMSLQQMQTDAAYGALDSLVFILEEEGKANKKALTVAKAIKAAEITASGIREVAQIWENASQLGPIAGPVFGVVQTAAAVFRTGRALTDIAGVALAKGGPTSGGETLRMAMVSGVYQYQGQSLSPVGTYASGGPVNQPSLGVIGEAGPEWVGPNWMLRSPKYANIFSFLESERLRARPFVDGGATSGNLPVIPDTTQQAEAQNEKMDMLIEVIMEQNERINEWAASLQVNLDSEQVEGAIQARAEVDAESTISR